MDENLDLDEYELPIPGLLLACKLSVLRATPPFYAEGKAGIYELLLLTSGQRVLNVGGEDIEIRGGEYLLIKPGTPHYDPAPHQSRSSMYYLYFTDPLETENFCFLPERMRRYLAETLANFPPAAQLDVDHAMENAMRNILTCVSTTEAEIDLSYHQYEFNLLTQLLLILQQLVDRNVSVKRPLSDDISQVIQWIECNPHELPSISQLAHLVHLSESHFKQKFKSEVGLPPGEYLNRSKVNMARQMLKENSMSIGTIAEQLGFSSTRHFTEVFKKYQAQSPSEYRKSMAPNL